MPAQHAGRSPTTHADKFMGRDWKRAVYVCGLWQISDVAVSPGRVDNLARKWRQNTHYSLEQGRFSSPVGSNNGQKPPPWHLSGEVVNCRMAIIAKGEVFELQGRSNRVHDAAAQSVIVQRMPISPQAQQSRVADEALSKDAGRAA